MKKQAINNQEITALVNYLVNVGTLGAQSAMSNKIKADRTKALFLANADTMPALLKVLASEIEELPKGRQPVYVTLSDGTQLRDANGALQTKQIEPRATVKKALTSGFKLARKEQPKHKTFANNKLSWKLLTPFIEVDEVRELSMSDRLEKVVGETITSANLATLVKLVERFQARNIASEKAKEESKRIDAERQDLQAKLQGWSATGIDKDTASMLALKQYGELLENVEELVNAQYA